MPRGVIGLHEGPLRFRIRYRAGARPGHWSLDLWEIVSAYQCHSERSEESRSGSFSHPCRGQAALSSHPPQSRAGFLATLGMTLAPG